MATATHEPLISPTLDSLLEVETSFSTVVHRHHASHLAMNLVALESLGAPPEILRDELAEYERRYATPRENPAALEEVRTEIARDGIDATVRAHAPAFVDGPGTQLFHAPIRLSYALDVGHEPQVAAAVLDWERRNTVLAVPEPSRGTRRVPEALAAVADEPEVVAHAHSIRDLDATARLDGFQRAVAELAIDDRTLDDVAELVLHAHLALDDFFTLHMMTGAHAIRVVAERLDEDLTDRLVARTVQVMAAVYLAVGAPPTPMPGELDVIRRRPLPSWNDIAAAAVADRDPHVVKLTYVARAEHARTGDDLYRHVAGRVTGLVDVATAPA